jgi:hypothetical protein
MQIVSAKQIRKSFRVHYGIDYSLEAIHMMAKRLGFTIRAVGGKRGYLANLYTELQRHWKELNECEKYVRRKKVRKPDIGYNPDKFIEPEGRADYEWEKDESIIRRAVIESVRKLLGGNVL